MAYVEFIWIEGPGGYIEYIAEHDVTMDEFEQAFDDFDREEASRSSGRPMRFGYTDTGRRLALIFEWADEFSVYPFTAYEVEMT